MRFLHIKRAYVVDAAYTYEVERDLASNTSLLDKVYGESIHDVCAITEQGEWLMHGKKMNAAECLEAYGTVFAYIHSPSAAYDSASLMCKAHAEKYVLVYKATDAIYHHAERLAALIQTYNLDAKIPHQIHLDTAAYNANFTSSDAIAAQHIRNVFMPVQVLSSLYRTHVPSMHRKLLANTHGELSAHIDSLRHSHGHITLRAQVTGECLYVAAIPNLRGKKLYITIPLSIQEVNGHIYFREARLSAAQKEEVHTVVFDVSHILFPKNGAVFALQAHPKRGVFIQGTTPLYFFVLHNHEFIFETAERHGIPAKDLFESML
jgi:hypothetical protein